MHYCNPRPMYAQVAAERDGLAARVAQLEASLRGQAQVAERLADTERRNGNLQVTQRKDTLAALLLPLLQAGVPRCARSRCYACLTDTCERRAPNCLASKRDAVGLASSMSQRLQDSAAVIC